MRSCGRQGARAVGLTVVALSALLLAPAPVVSSDEAPSAPPSVSGLCSTDRDYLWTISTGLAGLAASGVEYSTDFSAWQQSATLSSAAPGGASVVVVTSKDAGTSLSARWAAFPALVESSAVPEAASCAPGTVVITETVQGGPANASDFDFTLGGTSPSPPDTPRETTQVKAGAATTVPPGRYVVAESLDNLPAGYLWMSTTCEDLTTADPVNPGLIVFVAPGDTVNCEVVDHYGPLLTDTIAPGVNRRTSGFGIASVVVPWGSYVTYLVRTDPNLAGKPLQIWTRSKTGAWAWTTTRTVAGDGTVRYYA